MRKTPAREELEDALALEIGKLVMAWNYLQEMNGLLLCALTTNSTGGFIHAIWNSTTNDRAQREMLAAAAAERHRHKKISQKQCDDIIWLVNRTNSLADQRNDVVHAPYMFFTDENESSAMSPLYLFGNVRARKLQHKNLIKEIRWYTQRSRELTAFALAMEKSLSHSDRPWPDRPPMPSLGLVPTRKA